jgi:hypothetical protein
VAGLQAIKRIDAPDDLVARCRFSPKTTQRS